MFSVQFVYIRVVFDWGCRLDYELWAGIFTRWNESSIWEVDEHGNDYEQQLKREWELVHGNGRKWENGNEIPISAHLQWKYENFSQADCYGIWYLSLIINSKQKQRRALLTIVSTNYTSYNYYNYTLVIVIV